jgi:3-hydroxybutyryl-CoA dehydrogenase
MTHPLSQASVVGVIGAGAMGAGIAQVAATSGHPVVLFDIDPVAVDKALSGIAASLAKLADKGRLTKVQADAATRNVISATALAELKHAALVVEAVAERLDVKQRIFGELESIVDEHCIFATNTSSISVTAIAASLRDPSRLAGLHFFNPAPVMALVEVVSGLATSPAIIDTLHETAVAWGKLPVRARSTPGFIVNRVARPFYAEALRVLNEQASDVATVDRIMRDAGGFRMGPFELMDLIGHDVNFAVTESVFRAMFFDQRFTPSLIQQELVSAGFLGRKSGRGFYRYAGGGSGAEVSIEPSKQAAGRVRVGRSGALLHPLVERLAKAAGENCDDSTRDIPGLIAEVGGALLLITDGQTATRRARDLEHDDVVLVDLALDYGTARTLAVTRASQCSRAAFDAVVGTLQQCGYEVASISDVAGMVVMRTVAMLVNEAADAVNQGVCSVPDLDLAMEKGVNYPAGPLKWADAIGVATVHRVLFNLAAHYGEDRYRISPLLADRYWSAATFYPSI